MNVCFSVSHLYCQHRRAFISPKNKQGYTRSLSVWPGGTSIENGIRPVDAGADAETSTIKPGENEFPVSCEAG